MGSTIEFNDTLKLTKEEGFPKGLTLEGHLRDPERSREFLGQVFDFSKLGERLFHRRPTRVYLVEELELGRWLFWGHAMVTQVTITDEGRTEGQYAISQIYQPSFQRQMTIEESPPGKSYFNEEPTSFIE